MNAPRAEANKSMAEVEKTVVSLSGVLKSRIYFYLVAKVDIMDDDFVQCCFRD